MDTDLLTEAKHLASRGWLPGIGGNGLPVEIAKDADLHLAAHNEIVRRGWEHWTRTSRDQTYVTTTANHSIAYTEPGTTTLSLLRCLRLACEAAEQTEGAKA